MEWNNGEWTQSPQDTTMKPISETQMSSVNGGNKETTSGADAVNYSVTPDRRSTPNLRSSQKELQTSPQTTIPRKKRVKHTNGDPSHGIADVALSHDSRKSKTKHREASNHGSPPHLDSPTSSQRVQSDMKQSEDSSQPSSTPEVKGDNEKLSSSGKRARKQRLRGEAQEETVVETLNKSDDTKPLFGPIVLGLAHKSKMINSHGDSSSKHLKLEHTEAVEGDKKNMDDHESIEREQRKEGEVSNRPRKRGRPPKESIPKTNETGCLEKEEEKNKEVSNGKDDERKSFVSEVEKAIDVVEPSETSDNSVPDLRTRRVMDINDQTKQSRSDIRRRSMTTSKEHLRKRKLPSELVSELLKTVAKKGKKQKSIKEVESLTQDDGDKTRTRALEEVSNEIDRSNTRTSSNASDDDRPLSTWFEGSVSPLPTDFRSPPIEDPPVQSDGRTEREDVNKAIVVGQVDEQVNLPSASVENIQQLLAGNGNARLEQLAIQPNSTAIVAVDNPELPFIKNSIFWQLLDNMEIIKRIPQNPHFRPLLSCKEECREGVALGTMITFTSLAERISKSRFNDPRSLLDGYLEALVDLEELGFNVAPLRDMVMKLISLKDKYEQTQSTAKEIESQIMEHNQEMSTINGEMVELDRKIAELMEKRALVGTKKERKEAEITLLQTSIEAVKGTLETAEEEFDKITSALR